MRKRALDVRWVCALTMLATACGGSSGPGDVTPSLGTRDAGAGADAGIGGALPGSDAGDSDAGSGTKPPKDAGERDSAAPDANVEDAGYDGGGVLDAGPVLDAGDGSAVDISSDAGAADGGGDATTGPSGDSGVVVGGADAGVDSAVDASSVVPPAVSTSATVIHFGAGNCGGLAPAGQTLTVTNSGQGVLSVNAAFGTTNFAISPSSAALNAGQSQTFSVSSQAVPLTATAGSAIADTLTLSTSDPAKKTLVIPVDVIPTGVTLALNPTSAAFGSSPLDVVQDMAVSLANTGNVSATVTVTQPSDVEYAVLSGSALATSVGVAAGSAATLALAFQPATTSLTSTSAALTLDPSTPICGSSVTSIPMSGQGAIGALTLSAAALSFGANGLSHCGSSSGAQSVTIGNDGNSPFHITNISLGGTSSVPYSISGVAAGATVNPGTSGNLVVSVQGPAIPSVSAVPGNYNDTLVISTDIPGDASHVIPLQLGAQGVILSYDTTSIPFGFVPSGTTQTSGFNVINSGNAAAHVTLAAATDGGGALFGASPGAQFTLQGNSNGTSAQASQASFSAPDDTSPHTGSIVASVASGDVLCQPLPANIALSGTGQNGGISTSTNSISFGNGGLVACGTTAGAQTLTVTNSGNETINYYTSLGLASGSPYSVSPACTAAAPCALPPGQASAATLTVTPQGVPAASATTTDLYADTLTVFSTAVGDTGHTVALHETAQGAILAFSPAVGEFGQIPTNSSQQQTISVLNSGNAATTVALALAQSDSGSEFSLSSSSVSAATSGTSGQFTVTFAPNGDTAAQTGTITPSASGLCAPLPSAIQLGGQGTEALISVPGTVNFNQGSNSNGGVGISCGATAQAETLIIQNTGSQDAQITGLSLGLGATSPFNVPPTTPIDVPAGGTAQIQLTAKAIPATVLPPGNFSDVLTVTTNALNDLPHAVALNMNAAGVVLSMSSTSLQFSPTTNNTSSSVSFDLTNAGNINAPVVFSAPAQSVFTMPGSASVSATGQPVAFNANFAPVGSGTTTYQSTSTLSLADGTPNCGTLPGPSISLNGTGESGTTISYSPSSINFGHVNCGATPPAAQTITVFNTATSAASLTASLGGAWYTLGAVPSTVPAAVSGVPGSATFTVQPRLIPTAFTTLTGANSYADQIKMVVGGVDYYVTLGETAEGAILSFNTSALSVNRGKTSSFYVRNTGNASATIGLSDTNAASFSYLPGGTSIIANANQWTPFTVTDNASATASDTVTITSSSALCQPLALAGTQNLPLSVSGK